MLKKEIVVPKGVRYIGLWKGFKIPDEPHIMDKQIPGCGFTEFCLTNSDNTILASPRKVLLENKRDQHKEDVYLVINEFDNEPDVDKDLNSGLSKRSDPVDLTLENGKDRPTVFNKIKPEIIEYIKECDRLGKPYKILVTYDSFRIIKKIVTDLGILESFQVVIDEFQSIFTDSRFKSSTELGFVSELQGINRACYLSATPMMEKYLSRVPEFKDLPYYELNWEKEDPARVIKPNLHVRVTSSIVTSARKVIESYKSGNFVKSFRGDGSSIFSKEAVLYVNSVLNITSIIKKCGLKPEECNILVARTERNEAVIKKKLGKKFDIGRVPLRDEPKKMFTFCTRTVYLGADFYSDNARTFVFSDANLQTLAVDISLDLPQILGRQRLQENPWRNEADFYYRSLTENNRKICRDDFDALLEKKESATHKLLGAYKSSPEEFKGELLNKYWRDIVYSNYRFDYIAINGSGDDRIPVRNELVIIAEERAFDIQSIDYKNRFSVFSSMSDSFKASSAISEFLDNYKNITGIVNRLKYICELELSDEDFKFVMQVVDNKVRSYLQLGKDILKANSYHPKEIDDAVKNKVADIEGDVLSNFKDGEGVTTKDINSRLQEIYDKHGMTRKTRARDLDTWFNMKRGKFKNADGKWENGFTLTKK